MGRSEMMSEMGDGICSRIDLHVQQQSQVEDLIHGQEADDALQALIEILRN